MKKSHWARIAFAAVLLGFLAGCAADKPPAYMEAPVYPMPSPR